MFQRMNEATSLTDINRYEKLEDKTTEDCFEK